ncbi:hypothetical protein [Candidatus Clostridium stratigraminis]|uniref:Uncharacterized protein n=1 Tax=Candidatus Clostridium stratigraminis TaxID=3381661 RepID=A0ABW8T7V4_9CLOT
MAKFQLNTGLRISNVFKVKVSDILMKKLNFNDYFVPYNQKIKKRKLNYGFKTA